MIVLTAHQAPPRPLPVLQHPGHVVGSQALRGGPVSSSGVGETQSGGGHQQDGQQVEEEEETSDQSLLPEGVENGEEQETVRRLHEIANNIVEDIVMTVDLPENFDDKKLPILDMKVWLGEEDGWIYYQHIEQASHL